MFLSFGSKIQRRPRRLKGGDLGTAATKAISFFAQITNNLSDLASAVAARSNLGSTAVGDALFIAVSALAARGTLGSTTVGDALFVAANAAAARSTLGVEAAPTVSLATSGSITFANGWIVQWGIEASGTSDASVTFPSAFPNACYAVVPGMIALDGVASNAYLAFISGITTTGFAMRKRDVIGTSGPAAYTGNAYWIAIGK